MTESLDNRKIDAIIHLMDVVSKMALPSVIVCDCGCGAVSVIDEGIPKAKTQWGEWLKYDYDVVTGAWKKQ